MELLFRAVGRSRDLAPQRLDSPKFATQTGARLPRASWVINFKLRTARTHAARLLIFTRVPAHRGSRSWHFRQRVRLSDLCEKFHSALRAFQLAFSSGLHFQAVLPLLADAKAIFHLLASASRFTFPDLLEISRAWNI